MHFLALAKGQRDLNLRKGLARMAFCKNGQLVSCVIFRTKDLKTE